MCEMRKLIRPPPHLSEWWTQVLPRHRNALEQSHAGQFLRTGPSKQMKYEYKAIQIMQYSILIFNHVCLFVLRFLQNVLLGIPWKHSVVSDPIRDATSCVVEFWAFFQHPIWPSCYCSVDIPNQTCKHSNINASIISGMFKNFLTSNSQSSIL